MSTLTSHNIAVQFSQKVTNRFKELEHSTKTHVTEEIDYIIVSDWLQQISLHTVMIMV